MAVVATGLVLLGGCDTGVSESDTLTRLPIESAQSSRVEFLGTGPEVVAVVGRSTADVLRTVAQVVDEGGTGREVVLAETPTGGEVVGQFVDGLVVSPDGQTFVYALDEARRGQAQADRTLRAIGSDGTAARVIARVGVAPFEDARALSPTAISPDGRRLLLNALVADPATGGQVFRIAVLDLATGAVFRPEAASLAGALAFAPDGGVLTYELNAGGNPERLVVVGLDGARRPVGPDGAQTAEVAAATFSRDGRFLLYLQYDADYRASRPVLRDLTTGQDTPLAEAGAYVSAGLITPDGDRVLYRAPQPGPGYAKFDLFSVGRDGQGRERVAAGLPNASALAVSDDGTRVLLQTNTGGRVDYYLLRLDG